MMVDRFLPLALSLLVLSACGSPPSKPTKNPDAREHADAAFDRLSRTERGEPDSTPQAATSGHAEDTGASTNKGPSTQGANGGGQGDVPPAEVMSGEQEIRAIGYGALSRGRQVCQRAAEMAARAALAREVRVFVSERAVDRERERTGKPAELDLEVVREERVEAALQGVQIIARRDDQKAGTCSCTAQVLRSRVIPMKDTNESPAPVPR